ncbi:MAG: hypothetical protein LBE61_10670 [Burkholderiaceae bacterium]|jgi:hypothetical protein|nr:hypothetical protein [Burkholderiaceae bacterium]
MPTAEATHLIDDALWSRTLTHQLAAEMAGSTLVFFYADAQGHTQSVELQLLTSTPATETRGMCQFSVRLLGPSALLLAQQTYRARHAAQGDFALFIGPVARTAQGIEYEACISHAL